MNTLILLRHGQSQWNLENRFTGWEDVPLTDKGITEAKLAGYGLLGKEAPPYVALPALPVSKDNILDAWSAVYYQDAPDSIVKSLD